MIVHKKPGEGNSTADCPRCGQQPVRFVWQRFINNTKHVRTECRRCGRFLCYAPQRAEVVALADVDTTEQTRAELRELIGGDGMSEIRTAWTAKANELTDWALARVFPRTGRYGGYYVNGGETKKTTRPKDGAGEGVLTREVLFRHFGATGTSDVIGAHPLTAGENSVGRWVGVDIDAHGTESDSPEIQERNKKYSLFLFAKLKALGFRVLVATWGTGGYHLLVLFDRDVSGPALFAFGKWLVKDAEDYGFPEEVETFPKQGSVPSGKYGNWLRLVGRHHTLNRFAAVYDGSAFVQGDPAVELILALTGDSPDLITAAAAPKAPKPKENGHVTDGRKFVVPPSSSNGRDVFKEYKPTLGDVFEWQERKGHKVTRRESDRVDFTRAGKDGDGMSFNVKLIDGVPLMYNFSTNAGLPDGRGINPVQLRCLYEMGGCDKPHMNQLAAVLKQELGWADEKHDAKDNKNPEQNLVAWEIIPDFFRTRYLPGFKVEDAIYSGRELRHVKRLEACASIPTGLIYLLGTATNAPRIKNTVVDEEKLPGFFRKWAGTAWGALLDGLPDEDTAELGGTAAELAAEEFKRLVQEGGINPPFPTTSTVV